MMFVVPIANGGIEAPALGLDQPISAGLADAYAVPSSLGWYTPRANFTTAFGFFAPKRSLNGRPGDNIGKNMWSHELSARHDGISPIRTKAWSVAASCLLGDLTPH